MQLYAEAFSRCEAETPISQSYGLECLNHSENANFIPYESYNFLGDMAARMFRRHPEPTKESPDQSKDLPDIIPRQTLTK